MADRFVATVEVNYRAASFVTDTLVLDKPILARPPGSPPRTNRNGIQDPGFRGRAISARHQWRALSAKVGG